MRRGIIIILYLLSALTGFSRSVNRTEAVKAGLAFARGTFPEGTALTLFSVTPILSGSDTSAFAVNLKPAGWVLISGDNRTEPVLAYAVTGRFDPAFRSDAPIGYWMNYYGKQLNAIRKGPTVPGNATWNLDPEGYRLKSAQGTAVEPLIPAEWDQGKNWNVFCPADNDGPGDHAYVGCVGVSMAQAMYYYKYPMRPVGSKTYYEDTYGTLVVHYDREAPYRWDSMATDAADTDNARLLYHCAISVGMDFGSDGSSAQTKNIASALSKYFKYYSGVRYVSRYTSDSSWTALLTGELLAGRPVVYSGRPADNSVGHAFNIDGVDIRGYYHLNWGWSGSYNGYYLINNLRPGSNDFSTDQGAVVGIRPPVYAPTDLELTKSSVKEGLLVGSFVGRLKVIDEAPDNKYVISLSADSAGVEPAVFMLSHDTLRTSKVFLYNEQVSEPVYVMVTDTLGHTYQEKFIISILKASPTGVSDVDSRNSPVIYPNPSGGDFYIDNSLHQVTACRLIDLQGRLLLQKDGLQGVDRIQVNIGVPGTYILQLADRFGRFSTHNVVVR
jgi:hypothetical protein